MIHREIETVEIIIADNFRAIPHHLCAVLP